MKKIPLRHGLFALVDNEDYGFLKEKRWGIKHGRKCSYAVRYTTDATTGKRRAILMHRSVVNCPTGMVVDHIDGNGLNNQKSNLRICTHEQNRLNSGKRSHNIHPYKGVVWRRNGWDCRITFNGARIWLGRFKDPKEAALVYNKAAVQYHGQYARLNEV